MRLLLLPIFVCFNLFALVALRRTAARWVPPEHRSKAVKWIGLGVLLLNLPLLVSFITPADSGLQQVPRAVLRIFFYPASAWLVTILAFFLIAFPLALIWRLARALAGWVRKAIHFIFGSPSGQPSDASAEGNLSQPAVNLSRRNFLTTPTGLLLPGIYGVAAYGIFSKMDQIDISQEYSIPIAHLPRSLEGLTIVQISDLHAGPYIRERELQHVADLTNELHPDLVVITGDVLDRHLVSLPDAVNGLKGIRAPLGVFAVLGNHDYSADRFSTSGPYRGAVHIAEGLGSVGIRTLRNQVVHLGEGNDRLALMGLDWLTASPTDRSFFRYRAEDTRRHLRRMAEEAGPETPRILLAHHPDTFRDVAPHKISLTLSGHTHGGGQVVLGSVDGVPIGLATLRYKYFSGLYQENGCSLYVNRGIGYLGIPIRINCPPEISRFKLICPATT